MWRVNIDSQKHGIRYLDFPTESEADAYISQVTISEHWGLNPWVEVIPAVLDENNVEITPEQTINHPGTWSYNKQDITAQFQAEQLFKNGLKRQELGNRIIAQVFAVNEAKGLTPAGFQAMLENVTLQNIERLLKNGSLRTAKTLIQGLDETFFTTAEKDQIIALIDGSGLV